MKPSFVWKSPGMLDLQRATKVSHAIERNIVVYHTRDMWREFRERLVWLQNCLQLLQMKCTVIYQITPLRILALLDSDNQDIVLDMRSVHEKKDSQFNLFFSEVEKYLHEYEVTDVDNRRNGLKSHMAVVMSV